MSEAAAAAPTASATQKKKKKFNVPTAFTILFIITILAVIATWCIPAGKYAKLSYVPDSGQLMITQPDGSTEMLEATQEALEANPETAGMAVQVSKFVDGSITKPISIPGTYTELPSKSKGLDEITLSMVRGTIDGVDIMVFIFVLGGLIGVVNLSGAFEAGLHALTKKTKGREFLLVFLVAVFMLVGGTTCGLEEEAVAFYPILVPIFLALGYDSIICVGAIFLAGSMGTTFSTINPFAAVIASNAAGINFLEGIGWRTAGLIVGGIAVIAYLYWYSKKIKADPTFSYTYEDREHFAELYAVRASGTGHDFNWRKKAILILFVAAFVIMVYGVMALHWWFPQMAGSFLLIAIICMIISGKNEKECTEAFTAGSASLVGVSLIIGLARGINLILDEGLISDTILYWASNAVAGMPGPIFVVMVMLVFFLLGFIVPSSSGLAVLAMPIFAPLADAVGIDRYTIVCAYNWGQYAMLYLAPTGLVMATLQMLDMKYQHWLKFVTPMVIFLLVFGSGMLIAQTLV